MNVEPLPSVHSSCSRLLQYAKLRFSDEDYRELRILVEDFEKNENTKKIQDILVQEHSLTNNVFTK